jgi:putative ABC transport system permease protein
MRMSFLTMILKNLVRQRVRAALTMLGIAIGITTVVALGVITEGLKASAGQILRFGGSDFIVAQEGTADLSFSNVSEDDVQAVAAMPGVESAVGALMDVERVGSNPYFVVMGMRAEDVSANPPRLIEGRLFAPGVMDEIVIGSQAASSLDREVGDTVEISDRAFTVVGIYQSDETWLDGAGRRRSGAARHRTGDDAAHRAGHDGLRDGGHGRGHPGAARPDRG